MNEAIPTSKKPGNDNVPVVARPFSLANKDTRPDVVAVRLLMLKTPCNVPGEDSAGRVRHDPAAANNQRRWIISYIPAIRHFEITYYSTDLTKPADVGYIHEENASCWWPLKQTA